MGVCWSKTKTKSTECNKSADQIDDSYTKAVDPVILSTFTLFNLTVDCFDEIFEYLSLEELNAFGQTCTTMQQVAGVYFQRNYSAAKIFGSYDGIHVDSNNRHRAIVELFFGISIPGFEPFINSITIQAIKSPLQYIEPYIDQFNSVKSVNFMGQILITSTVKPMLKMLREVETVQIQIGCKCNDLYHILLRFCGKMKRLYVQNADFDFIYYGHCGKRKWLMQDYPCLEHFEYIPRDSLILNELNSFLERNKTIHTFSTSSECLWKNRHAFMNSEATLNILEIKCDQEFGTEALALQSLRNLINQLHERRFYKRLHFYVSRVDEELNCHVVSLNGLQKLCIKGFYGSLPSLNGLKELALLDYFKDLEEPGANGMEQLANNFGNIQRLYLGNATSINDIMPFIRQSLKLNKIKILFKNENRFRSETEEIIQLVKLNKERQQIFEARKVTIYVPDDYFLATKWATKNGDMNLNLIELKRADSYEWHQHY